MGSLLNISLFIIATVLAVCYVIYSLIVAYQSSVKMSNRTGSNETRDIEDSQDALFGLFYFLIFIISLNRLRLYYDQPNYKGITGGRTINRNNNSEIAIFYTLISCAAALRSVWFLIPSDNLEGGYIPTSEIAYKTSNWFGVLISEVLLSAGSIFIYAIFVLLLAYWKTRINDFEIVENEVYEGDRRSIPNNHGDYYRLFLFTMSIIVLVYCIIIALYFYQCYNSQVMLVVDSFILSLVSIVIFVCFSWISYKMQLVLKYVGLVKKDSTRPQIRSVYLITFGINLFFVIKVGIECTFAVSSLLVILRTKTLSYMVTDKFWITYIFIKHFSEVILLALTLLISTPVKKYENHRRPSRGDMELHSINDSSERVVYSPLETTPIKS